MNLKQTLKTSLKSAGIILKLIIPIYILADILFYYNILSHISFLVEPITSTLGLPPEASLSIISGIFLSEYAAIAFAAPLNLTIHQWSILAVFIGICHALIVEGVIMKKIGLKNTYSYSLRIIVGFIVAYLTALIPSEYFNSTIINNTYKTIHHKSISELLYTSLSNSIELSLKIIIFITILVFIMDFIKTRKFITQSKQNVSKGFSLIVGIFLGTTYGAGLLINEVENKKISKEDIFYIGTFLMICHAIIEDTLLFVIFGADFTMVVLIRTISAIIISYILLLLYRKIPNKRLFLI